MGYTLSRRGLHLYDAPVGDWFGKLFFQRHNLLYAGALGPTQPHRHHALQVVLSLEGSITVGKGDGAPSACGAAAVIGPDVDHAIVRGSPSAVLLYVDPDERLGRQAHSVCPLDTPQRWIERGASLRACIPRSLPKTWDEARGLVQAISDNLAACDAAGASGTLRRVVHPAVLRARRYIDANLAYDVRADAVASAAGISTSRLAQLFASDVGVPLRSYVRWCRMRATTGPLQAGSNLAAAAAEAGFSDGAHLTRTFRQMFGIAPSEIMAVAQWVGSDVP